MTVIVESDYSYLGSKNSKWIPVNRQVDCEIVFFGAGLTTPDLEANHSYSLAGATLTLRDNMSNVFPVPLKTDLSELFDMNKRYKITITEEDV